jgi:hypothetical protein
MAPDSASLSTEGHSDLIELIERSIYAEMIMSFEPAIPFSL